MFCSHCGTDIEKTDNFCGACGTKAGGTAPPPAAQPRTNWHTSTRYLDVIREGDVAHVYALAETEGGSAVSGDDFVSLITPAMPIKGFTSDVMRAGEKYSFAVYSKLGLVRDLTETHDYAQPIGKVIAAVACALASEKQRIEEVDQMADGCLIKVRVPPGLATGAKFMDVSVTQTDGGAQVTAKVNSIAGKWQQKSTRAAADELKADIARFLRLLG